MVRETSPRSTSQDDAVSHAVAPFCFRTITRDRHVRRGIRQRVTYLPVSALGDCVESIYDERSGRDVPAVRTSRVQPQWTSVPWLYALHCVIPQLIDREEPASTEADANPRWTGLTDSPSARFEREIEYERMRR